jgi:Xaa-Pro aminopeptidase
LFHLQAESQIDENWTLMRMGIPGVPSLTEWIEQNLEEGSVVGIDPFLCPIYLWDQIKSGLETSGHRLVTYFH